MDHGAGQAFVDLNAVADASSCRQRILELESSGRKEELSSYYSGLPYLLLTTNIVPVVYLKKPERSSDPVARKYMDDLAKASQTSKAVREFVRSHIQNKALLKEVFLSQGYLFADRPDLASALVAELTISDLFDAKTLYLYRGEIKQLERHGDEYVDENCERAKLLLNDRLAEDPADLHEPLHIDLDEVRRLTGAVRTLVQQVAGRFAWIDLVFPDSTRRSAFVELKNGETAVSCIADDSKTLSQSLAHAKEFWQWHQKIVRAANLMVAERPGFDEPKDEAEDVQEDGDLRLEWTKAYWSNESTYWFRNTEYPVFDSKGNPTPPQVCIDFVFDTWERASGTWFKTRDQKKGRTKGEVDFSVYRELHRRQTPSVLAFAESENSPLDRFDIARRDWVPFLRKAGFARVVARYADRFREGDALIIHGLREEDMEEHYHALLVLRTDPLTGMPMMVGDNAGHPRLRSLADAMRSAPSRSIKHIIRINRDKFMK
jgi:hypothetical protein